MRKTFQLLILLFTFQAVALESTNTKVVWETKAKDGKPDWKIERVDYLEDGKLNTTDLRLYSYLRNEWVMLTSDQSFWYFFSSFNDDYPREIKNRLSKEVKEKIYRASLAEIYKNVAKKDLKKEFLAAQKKRKLSDEEAWILKNYL